jgi:hypothetical protein
LKANDDYIIEYIEIDNLHEALSKKVNKKDCFMRQSGKGK